MKIFYEHLYFVACNGRKRDEWIRLCDFVSAESNDEYVDDYYEEYKENHAVVESVSVGVAMGRAGHSVCVSVALAGLKNEHDSDNHLFKRKTTIVGTRVRGSY